ncbi:MAG: hypothetical protein N3G20_07525 [Verrucomicrobiae bacterium]|nr:hypothetical protein [Verrucomicrobiae bacterium]
MLGRGRHMPETLFCFAMWIEARPFLKRIDPSERSVVLVTGMGRRNAAVALRQRLALNKPARVISCGFAGGLAPELKHGDVLFEAKTGTPLSQLLENTGARRARFHTVDKVACTTAEKRKLYEATGAHAVDMESAGLAEVCETESLEFAIVRAISDTAAEDLPIDFNRFIKDDAAPDLNKVVLWFLPRPALIPRLFFWYRRLHTAAVNLAEVLHAISRSPY